MLQRKHSWRAPAMLIALCTGVAFPLAAPALAAGAHPLSSSRYATPHRLAAPPRPAHPAPRVVRVGALRPAPRVTPVAHAQPAAAHAARPAPRATRPVARPRVAPHLTMFTTARAPAAYARGTVMHYYAGLFERVARNRGMRLRSDVDGYASRPSCGELGRIVTARILNPWSGAWGPWRRYQIVDCSARRDLAYQRSFGLILEVDYHSAAVSGFLSWGRSAVEVAR